MLVSMKDMLQHALRDGYAVGQFNINNASNKLKESRNKLLESRSF